MNTKFAITLHEEDRNSIASDVRANLKLKQMLRKSVTAYHEGQSLSTVDLLKSLTPKDFER